MRLTYRVLHEGGASDVRIELVDDATVGELARALARRCGADPDIGAAPLTLSPTADPDSTIDPDRPAADAAPPSGSSIRLVADRSRHHRPPWWSPASIDRLGDDGSARLAYGSTAIGAARIVVGHEVTVVATGSTDRLEVDGTPVRGSVRVDGGAVIRVGDSTVVLRIDGPLRPPPAQGPWREHGRTPAVVADHSPTAIELPAPPSADRLPGFPFLSAAVPLLLGGIMWAATGSLAVAGFVLFSVAFVVASGIEVRREHRKERRFREQVFREDLDRAVERAEELRSEELRRRRRDLPDASEVATWARHDRERVWERWSGQPRLLRVRIGTGTAPATDPVAVPPGGRHDLRQCLESAAEELAEVDGPVEVDLGRSGLGVCGRGDEPAALARAVVLQLVGTIAPEELALELDAAPERRAEWEWLRWLPHRVRIGPSPTEPDEARSLVRIVDRSGVAEGRALAAPDSAPAAGTIWIAGSEDQLPCGIGTVVTIRGRSAQVRRTDGPPHEIEPDAVVLDACEPVARLLAPLRSPGTDEGTPVEVPLSAVLVDPMLVEDADAVVAAWERSRDDPASLRAPLGRAGAGVLHLDLRADGPHGLVAGTTGSGKSELLRTLVLSLALHHPPDRLTFLLVDYKGGAAFQDVSALPHVVGSVTDLGADESRRALASLRAEVRRRERVVAAAGATDMSCVPPDDAAPALVVVVDEFATLAAELPGLLDGLLDVAQRGRSLGVHLLLATQRPSGVVTDAMRANLSLRLALRVADEDDSRDVVDVADAAHVSAEHPGRAVLRLGPGRVAEVQVATTTAPVGRVERVRVRPLHTPTGGDPDDVRHDRAPAPAPRTQLDAAIEACRVAARASGIAPARRPWLEPLPDVVERVDAAVRSTALPSTSGGRLVIGVADLPHEQRRESVEIDLGTRGGLLVLGAPRSGRSSTLCTIALAALSDAAHPTTVVAIDAGRSLSGLGSVAGPGGRATDAVRADDAERILRLLRTLRRRCRSGARAGRTVLLVDGIGSLADHHERVNRGEALDLLGTLVAEGPAVGIHVVLTAGRTAEVPPAMLAALDRRLVLRCTTPDDALMVGIADPDRLSSTLASPALPPGRGVLDGVLVQVFAPPTLRDRGAAPPMPSAALPVLPNDVRAADLPAADGWRLPVGVRHDDLRTAVIDLTTSGALILGPPRSGRTCALDLIVERLAHPDDDGPAVAVVRLDGHRPDGAVDALRDALDTMERDAMPLDGAGRMVIAVDDLPELLDGPDGGAVDELLACALRLPPEDGLRVVATGESDATSRCYGDSLRRLRSGRTGILLRPDPDLHPPLLHTALPLHDELVPSAGRGWLVTPDGVTAVQLAH